MSRTKAKSPSEIGRLPRTARVAGALAITLIGAGCAESSPDLPPGPPLQPEEKALAPCSASLPGGREVRGDGELARGGLCVSPAPDDPAGVAGDPTLRVAAAPLVLDGHTALGPAVTVAMTGALGRRGMDVTLPLDFTKLPESARAMRHGLVVLSKFGSAPVHVTPLENIAITNFGGGQLRFHLPGHGIGAAGSTAADLATFQVAAPAKLGQKVKRRFTYRAIGGVSMGGIGASMNFFRHADRYDAVGVMGADPGPDLTYAQGFIRDFFFGGFCTDDSGKLGQTCAPPRAPLAGQGELTGTFEAMPIQRGEGIGLTLKRSLYLRANRDLVRALGNWAFYNPADPYLPPGVPAASLAQDPATACANPVVLKGTQSDPTGKPFYDGRYNPAGKYDVITFCDGGERDDQPGVFDNAKTQKDPAQILLAVDLNGNKRRDTGEPVLLQSSEPFRDAGLDGVPDELEPGYDAVKNPDPAGDDYHYLKNPAGTEKNGRYDLGEPFDDFGLDGVKGKGCASVDGAGKPVAGCFDFGEGDGKFTLNPGLTAWLDRDPHALMEKLAIERLQTMDLYYDAGIRDFFNAHVSTSSLFGVLAQRGLSSRLFGGFPALSGFGPTEDSRFDPSAISTEALGRRVFVRYGNPELSDAVAAMTGDGRHAGAVPQVIQRAVVLFKFLLSRWPDADRSMQPSDDPRLTPKPLTLTQKNGRQSPFSVILPPGYFEPANQSVRYPVIYIGHGYGMAPETLGKDIGSLIHSFMSDTDEARRLPKAVLVFVDGVCRPGGDVPNGPLPTSGDLCEEGGFYADHPSGTYQGESMLDELDGLLRTMYRLREPSEQDVDY